MKTLKLQPIGSLLKLSRKVRNGGIAAIIVPALVWLVNLAFPGLGTALTPGIEYLVVSVVPIIVSYLTTERADLFET